MTKTEIQTTNRRQTGVRLNQYMDAATRVLKDYGINFTTTSDEVSTEFPKLLEDITDIDEPKVLAISQAVSLIPQYNNLVRENVGDITVARRYEAINEIFSNLIDDSKMLVNHAEKGGGLVAKLEQHWMRFRRGDINSRYDAVIEVGREVMSDTKTQITKEQTILDGYSQFRLALRGTEQMAYEVLELQKDKLTKAEEKWKKAQKTLEDFVGEDSQKSALELVRDEAAYKHQSEDRKYGTAKKIAENLRVSLNVGEVIMGKLQQSTNLKRDLYETGVIFYTTNEHILTAMSATHTSIAGNYETAKVIAASKDGMNRGLEYLAEIGGKVGEDALRIAHGKTIEAKSLGKLIDAMVDYQVKSSKIIAEARDEATKNADEIKRLTEDGRKRMQDAVLTYKPIKEEIEEDKVNASTVKPSSKNKLTDKVRRKVNKN